MDEAATLLALLRAAHRVETHLDRELRKSERGYTLSLQRYQVLDYILKHPECSRTTIAKTLGVTQASVSSTIADMLDRDLIEERFCDFERTRLRLTVTVAGAALVATGRDAILSTAERFNELLQEEQHCVASAAEKLLRAYAAKKPS